MSKNSVHVGFKITELGPLPEEWEVARLGDVAEKFIGGGTPSTSNEEYWNGEIHWTTSKKINGIHLLNGEKKITKRGLEESSTHLIPKDNLVIGTRVGVGKVAINKVDIAISQDLTGAFIDKEKYALEFLAYQICTKKIQNIFKGRARGTTIKGIPRDDLKKIPLKIPPLPEQHRIAAVLSAVQDAKEKTGAVIAAAKSLKKSLMRHLFTYGPVPAGAAESVPLAETEIGLVPEGWEVTQLGVICNLFQYGTSKRCHLDEVGIPVLRIPNVVNGRIDTQELKYINLEDKKAEKLRLSSGDLLFVRTNGQRKYVGRCSIYKEELRDALFASYLIRAKLNADVALPEYIQFYTTTQKGQEYLSGRASGAADGKFNINQQILKSVLVPLPPLPTQKKIASILSTVDKKIEAEENKKKAIDELFKSLLHNLMTGKIRVNHLEAIP